MKNYKFINRSETAVQIIGYLLAGLIFLFTLSLMINSIYDGINLIGQPHPGFIPCYYGLVYSLSFPDWTGWEKATGFPAYIKEVNGKRFANAAELWDKVRSNPVGSEFTYKIYESGKTREVVIPSMIFTLKDFIRLRITQFIFALFWLMSGALVFLLKPNKTFSWGMLLLSVNEALWVSTDPIVGTSAPAYFFVLFIFAVLPGPWIHAAMSVFGEFEFFESRPLRYGFFYVLPALSIVALEAIAIRWGFLFLSDIAIRAIMIFLAAALFGGLYVILHARFKSRTPITRQRARLLLLGLVIGSLGGAYNTISIIINNIPLPYTYLYLSLIFYPLFMSYAVLRHNLFEVDEIIKRSVIYGSLLVFTAGIYSAILLVSNYYLRGFGFYKSPLYIPVFLVLILHLLIKLKELLQLLLNRLLFRTKLDYNNVLEQIRRELSLINDRNTIVEISKRIICRNYLLTNLEILLEDPIAKQYRSIDGRFFLSAKEDIVRLIYKKKVLVSRNDVLNDRGLYRIRSRCLAQMARVEAVFVMPIFYRNSMIGIAALGKKKSAEESFNLQDINLLKVILKQVAVALQNNHLYQSLDKAKKELEQLNHELEEKVKQRTKELEIRNQDLIIANQVIEAATRHKSEFLASMSHELRTPLTAILGFNKLILTGIYGPVSEKIKVILRDLQVNGDELLKLINDVLDFSKLEAGKLKYQPEDFVVKDVIDEVLAENKDEIEGKGIKVREMMDKNLPMGWGDLRIVMRVLGNLVGNAAKFAKAKNITIRVTVEVIHELPLLLFEIEDDGIGIPKERLIHVFEEFQMPSKIDIKDYKGIGLGLALSKKLIELQGGIMTVESRVGEGSKFSFALPLKISGI